jgi:hypothetical protein
VYFTLSIFNQKTRNRPEAWRPLGYIPNIGLMSKAESTHATKSLAKVQLYHDILSKIVGSLVDLQGEEGGLPYGAKAPKNTAEALAIDKAAGNTLWQDAIRKEVGALMEMETFKLIPSETKASMRQKGYQMLPLRCIFDIKQDGRRKARIVIGGHLVDSSGYDAYAGNMKSISARLLMLITTANNLQVITGDIGNAYLYAKSDLETAVALGKEFNVFDSKIQEHTIAAVEKALYGLPTSANRGHAHLSDNLRAMGFKPTRFDPDV